MIAYLAGLLISRNPAMTLPYAKRLVKIGLVAVALIVAVVAFNLWLSGEKREAVEADRNAASAEALGKARTADEAANTASQDTSDSIEAENRAAAEAAAKSDDPLREGLNELRNRQR